MLKRVYLTCLPQNLSIMNYEEEANNLKEKYNIMLKQYKKHEKKKKDGGQLDSEFYVRDEELNHKISIFFKEYGRFIRTRKNSMGTFSVDDYVSYHKLSHIKMDKSYNESNSNIKKAFTMDEVFKNDDRRNYFQKNQGFSQGPGQKTLEVSQGFVQGSLVNRQEFLQEPVNTRQDLNNRQEIVNTRQDLNNRQEIVNTRQDINNRHEIVNTRQEIVNIRQDLNNRQDFSKDLVENKQSLFQGSFESNQGFKPVNFQNSIDSQGFGQNFNSRMQEKGFIDKNQALLDKHHFQNLVDNKSSFYDQPGSYISKNQYNSLNNHKGPFTSPGVFNQPAFFSGNKIPVINMGDRNSTIGISRGKSDNYNPNNINYGFNHSINYYNRNKVDERNINYNKSPTNINYNKSPTNINYNKSPSNINYNKSPTNINFNQPNFNQNQANFNQNQANLNYNKSPNFSKPSNLHHNYNPMNNFNSSANFYNQNKMINSRNMEAPTFIKNMSPNVMYGMSNKYYPPRSGNPYGRQNPSYGQNSYMHNTPFMQTRTGYMPNTRNEGFSFETPQAHPSSFYDKYVKNQISINDFIKSKKMKTDPPEVKPIILNKCTVSNKKVDNLIKENEPINLLEDPDKKTIEDLLDNKSCDEEAKDLLYEICDNFIQHVVLTSGELSREKKRFEKKDLKLIFKMEFGMDLLE